MTIAVMVVDDSNLARTVLLGILGKDEAIEVCAAVSDGKSALSAMQERKPDIITMDLNMPGQSGMEVTKQIMATNPVPIIIVTTDLASAANPFKLLEAGAIAVVRSPAPPGHPEHEQTASQLIKTIKALSGVKVFKRRDRTKPPAAPSSAAKSAAAKFSHMQCIAIGASTGGPQLLKQIFSRLPGEFSIPLVITQHIAKGFSINMARWLQVEGGVKVVIAEHGQKLEGGYAYIAPDDFHLGVNAQREIQLADKGDYMMRPAVGYMFKSVGSAFGKHCVAVLLTGMGKDGAAEMALLKSAGALTIAQDKESSLIHGMPGEAIACGGACEILAPDAIIAELLRLDKANRLLR